MRRSLVVACAVACAGPAGAQVPSVAGYYQNVAVGTAAGDGFAAGALDAQRARAMWAPKRETVALDVAYEHTLWWRDAPSTGASNGLLSSTRAGGDWLDLDWTAHEGDRVSWRHRFDRLSVAYTDGPVTATVGRQAVSWATTLFLTPADPFVPFNPADPFREYRTGIDAARVQWFAGPFSVVDLVVRPADEPAGRTITALARGKTTVSGWDLSAWAGAIHDAPGAAAGITRTVAGSAVRVEATVRRDTTGRDVARAAAGIDRRFSVLGRDLYLVLEYQHDGFGASRAADLAAVAVSPAATRSELQVLGRDETAAQVTFQVHPILSAELLALRNLRDGSVLLAPAASVSVSNNATLRAGVFATAGRGAGAFGQRSEYGGVPPSAYAAFSVFF